MHAHAYTNTHIYIYIYISIYIYICVYGLWLYGAHQPYTFGMYTCLFYMDICVVHMCMYMCVFFVSGLVRIGALLCRAPFAFSHPFVPCLDTVLPDQVRGPKVGHHRDLAIIAPDEPAVRGPGRWVFKCLAPGCAWFSV